MGSTEPHLAALSDEDRERLEAWLVEFDRPWDERGLEEWARRLPQDSPLRRPALIEMVKLDLERRWDLGQRVSLESYLRALPELGGPDGAPADLILAECKVRQRQGNPLDTAALARRFPRQADEVCWLLRQAPPPSSLAPPPGGTPLPGRPAGAGGTLPEWFGRYRIKRKLGEGGMGAVYLAHDGQLDRLVALKVPHPNAAAAPEVRRRFRAEARAAATIDHPNVCPVYDVGEANGLLYLAMAYVEGAPLSESLAASGPLSQRDAAVLVRKLALALEEAHRAGVVHRDLKPSNVMINRRGEPVVMDFGLALRAAAGDERLTRAGMPLGTPAYMPPEQASGDLADMGPRSDVYSLGVILFELLTGRRPFEGPVAAVWGQILTQPPPRPTEMRPDLAPALETVCLKAMAKKADDRYASMAEFAAALGDYLGEARPPEGRRGWRAAAAGVFVLLLVAALFVWFRGGPRRTAVAALREGVEALERSDHDAALTSLDEAVRLAPDNAEARYQRGRAHAIKRHDAQAIADLTRAIELGTTHAADAYNLRGLIRGGLGKSDDALADFSEALRLDPRHVKALVNRGSEHANRKDYPRALADFTRALETDPRCAEACNGRGGVYWSQGDYKQAVREYDQALSLKPSAHAYNNRGFARASAGDLEGAVADYDEGLRLDPGFAAAHANRGLAHHALNRPEKALADLTEAIRLAPNVPLFFRNRAAVYRKLGEIEAERADTEKAIQLETARRP